jgi:hypothetical protein
MDRDDRLAELLVRWEDATARGDPPTLDELCRDCPELLPDFRRLVARVGVVNALLQGETAGPDNAADLPVRIDAGRYRALGFHAAGGIGVVFTAEDQEVGRTVALKCMQDCGRSGPPPVPAGGRGHRQTGAPGGGAGLRHGAG